MHFPTIHVTVHPEHNPNEWPKMAAQSVEEECLLKPGHHDTETGPEPFECQSHCHRGRSCDAVCPSNAIRLDMTSRWPSRFISARPIVPYGFSCIRDRRGSLVRARFVLA